MRRLEVRPDTVDAQVEVGRVVERSVPLSASDRNVPSRASTSDDMPCTGWLGNVPPTRPPEMSVRQGTVGGARRTARDEPRRIVGADAEDVDGRRSGIALVPLRALRTGPDPAAPADQADPSVLSLVGEVAVVRSFEVTATTSAERIGALATRSPTRAPRVSFIDVTSGRSFHSGLSGTASLVLRGPCRPTGAPKRLVKLGDRRLHASAA